MATLPYASLRNSESQPPRYGAQHRAALGHRDGLGYDYLLRHGAGGALHRHLTPA
ncbi:MAG: hypothetical protein M5R42_01505 [Rhodocyclaceae bacterium]|nr:hypothetical protein [Rhodocyclaceae bacterium]